LNYKINHRVTRS